MTRGPKTLLLIAAGLAGCLPGDPTPRTPPPMRAASSGEAPAAYDPLAQVRAAGLEIANGEAVVPPACYTRTAGVANPCWTCHAEGIGPNEQVDWPLQAAYAFSDFARTNRWHNLFAERPAPDRGEADILDWIRTDNYTPLRMALIGRGDYPGYVPDLDLHRGVDGDGFARDGSGWRAVRFKPFPGTFWPSNGSVGDVFVRLPAPFRADADGHASRAVYRANLAILEAAIAADPKAEVPARRVEPVDERRAGHDLDGDGTYGVAHVIRSLPSHYIGGAADVPVERLLYPPGVEFLHPVRYLDPDAPGHLATRLKELRYAIKRQAVDRWGRQRAYAEELDAKERGILPRYTGDAEVGLRNDFGWQLQGFIEDAEGRLRVQTAEEQLYCMGCHTALSVTVDSTFSFARKVPGAAGWAMQDVEGMPDVPQAGHAEPETLTWFRRVDGGDEFRSNAELRARFWPDGALDEARVRRAAPGGPGDMGDLILPSRARALALNRAYRALLPAQRFDLGRDTVLTPPENVHRRIDAESTDLAATGRIYRDGRLHLDWSGARLER